jgi:Transcription factor IIIC subunit delta N-term
MAKIIASIQTPSTINALDWSDECVIAVSSQETVQLLVPSFINCSQNAQNSRQQEWQITQIKMNEFTTAEVPTEAPISFASYSTGEEISESWVTAVKWSPPGLGEHDRSVLSVLTSNLVLALWATSPDSSPTAPTLKRSLLFNHSLESLYWSLNPQEKKPSNGERSEDLKRFQRIRSFCWAPIVPINTYNTTDIPFWVALANDDAQILIANVRSPFTIPSANDKGWDAPIVSHFDIKKETQSLRPQLLWSFEDYMSNQRYTDQLTWSPWFLEDERYASFIAYTFIDEIVCRKVVFPTVSSELTIQILDFAIRIPIPEGVVAKGQLRFDTVVHRNQLTLICQIHNEIICCSILVSKGHTYTISRYGLEHWDELSGK